MNRSAGLGAKDIRSRYRGEFVYQAEADTHFPHLTVGQTLRVAAKARPQRPSTITFGEATECTEDEIIRNLGLSHTLNTKVGNDFVIGVSGGERKRTSLAGKWNNPGTP